MAVSIQFHKYTGRPKQEHNRNLSVRQKEQHIRGEDEGGWIEIWHDEDWQKAVDERIFGADIEEFNSKQTRKDRMKSSYYAECVEREQKDEEKNLLKIQEDKNGVFRPVHEFVVGVYGTDATQEQKIEILREFYENFKTEYPNFEVVGCYLHVDEQSDLVRSGEKALEDVDPHLHLDVVPVAHGYKRGMKNQISLSSAINELELFSVNKKQNELVQFEALNFQLLKTLCMERGLEVELTQEGEKEHKEKDIFILDKKKEAAEKKTASAEQKLEKVEQELERTKIALEKEQTKNAELKQENKLEQRKNLQLTNENAELQAGKEKMAMEYEKELLEKQMEIQQATEAIEKMEAKIEKMRDDANAEIEELKAQRDAVKQQKQGLQSDIEKIIKENQLSDDDVDDISKSMERVLFEAVKGGERIQQNNYSAADKSVAENELVSKCMQDMQSPFDKLRNHCNKLTEKIKGTVDYWKQSVETARIARTGGVSVFTGHDGRVSEAGKSYIERQIRQRLSERDTDESWQTIRQHYRTLTNDDKEKLVQKLVRSSIDYAEDSCVDKSAKYVAKGKLDKVIDRSAVTLGHGIVKAMQEIQKLQQQYVEEEFER